MTRMERKGAVTGAQSSWVRETQASGVSLRPGEVLVPTLLGNDGQIPLSCAAAPLVAGTLQRKGVGVRLARVSHYDDARGDGDIRMYMATCPQRDGGKTAIAAGAALGDRVAAAFAQAAVEEWASVAASRVVLAASTPWCSGALRAAERSRAAAAEHGRQGRSVRVLGPSLLPPETSAELDMLGAVQVTSLADAQEGDVVVFPAHGVSPEIRAEAVERGLVIIDATCPLVARAQETASQLAERGQHVVLIGQSDAAAAGPIASRATGQLTIVENTGGTHALNVRDAQRISYLHQPGIPIESANGVVSALRSRYPAARATPPAGLCYAPSDRLATNRSVAAGSELVLVLGDPDSADARQVAGQAREAGARVKVVGAVFDITPAMLAGVTTLGTIESTSAPAGLAAQVIAAIGGLGELSVARRQVKTELPASDPAADRRRDVVRRRPGSGLRQPALTYRPATATTKGSVAAAKMTRISR
jgi:4-hydroxy-3-methylbut-2-enyl diphosphate reductase